MGDFKCTVLMEHIVCVVMKDFVNRSYGCIAVGVGILEITPIFCGHFSRVRLLHL